MTGYRLTSTARRRSYTSTGPGSASLKRAAYVAGAMSQRSAKRQRSIPYTPRNSSYYYLGQTRKRLNPPTS